MVLIWVQQPCEHVTVTDLKMVEPQDVEYVRLIRIRPQLIKTVDMQNEVIQDRKAAFLVLFVHAPILQSEITD